MSAGVCRHCRAHHVRTLQAPYCHHTLPSYLWSGCLRLPIRTVRTDTLSLESVQPCAPEFLLRPCVDVGFVGARATRRLTATFSPFKSKRIDTRRSSIGWWVCGYTQTDGIFFPSLPNRLRVVLASLPLLLAQRKIKTVSCCRNSVFPGLLVSCGPMKSKPSCRASARCPYPFLLAQPGCANCRSPPLQAPPSASLEPRVLQTVLAGAWSDPSVFFVFFCSFPLLSRCRLSVFQPGVCAGVGGCPGTEYYLSI